MKLQGLDIGPPRLPSLPLPPETIKNMESDLRDVGFFEWAQDRCFQQYSHIASYLLAPCIHVINMAAIGSYRNPCYTGSLKFNFEVQFLYQLVCVFVYLYINYSCLVLTKVFGIYNYQSAYQVQYMQLLNVMCSCFIKQLPSLSVVVILFPMYQLHCVLGQCKLCICNNFCFQQNWLCIDTRFVNKIKVLLLLCEGSSTRHTVDAQGSQNFHRAPSNYG